MSGVWGMNCVRSLLHRAFVADRNCWQLTDLGRSFRTSSSRAENAFRHRSVCKLRDFVDVPSSCMYVLRGIWTTVDVARCNFRGKKQGFPSEGFR